MAASMLHHLQRAVLKLVTELLSLQIFCMVPGHVPCT